MVRLLGDVLKEAIIRRRGRKNIARYFADEKPHRHLVPDLQTIELCGSYLVEKGGEESK